MCTCSMCGSFAIEFGDLDLRQTFIPPNESLEELNRSHAPRWKQDEGYRVQGRFHSQRFVPSAIFDLRVKGRDTESEE